MQFEVICVVIGSSECASGHAYFAGVGCFQILLTHERANYTEAKQACIDNGGWLATLDNEAKNAAVRDYVMHVGNTTSK